MSKQLTENSARRDFHLIPVDEIIASTGWNGRHFEHDAKTVRNMAESILLEGQIQPVVVRRDKESNKIMLSVGFCRYLAIRLINETPSLLKRASEQPLRVKAFYMDQDNASAFVLNIRENKDRKATSAIDDAYNQERLRTEFAWTNTQIAEEYRCSSVWVGLLRKLLTLSEAIQKRVHSGEIPASIAIKLADLSPKDQQDVLDECEASGLKLTVDTVSDKKRNSKTDGDEGGNVARSLKQIREYLELVKEEKKDNDAPTASLANDFLRFINGRIGEKGMENAWTRYRDLVRK